MKMTVKIDDGRVEIFLKKGNKIIDGLFFPLDHELSEKLLWQIDKILKRNKLSPKNIEKALFSSKIKDSYTTVRIGKAVVNTFNWAKSQDKK